MGKFGIYMFGLWAESSELGVHSIADSNIVETQSCSIVLKLLEEQDLGP